MWTVERDERGRVIVPFYGAVVWYDHEADTYARRFLIDHQPIGVPWQFTIKPPFYTTSERRQCLGCRPGRLYSACEYALWAKAWQKKRAASDESELQRWS